MLCTNCKKREAIVFITTTQGNERKNEGLCLVCARDRNLPQINEYIKQMGLSDDNIEEFADAMTDMKEGLDNMDLFKPGGTSSPLPNFFNALFGGQGQGEKEDAPSDAKAEVRSADGKADTKEKKQKTGKKYLSNFCTHLTEKARKGELDRIIGRDAEIARAVQILCRRQKNNPCLIGEPGVGKTAIAEGLAQRIVEGRVPFQLADKEVYLLDLTALVAGTQFRGQFEARMKGLIDEIVKEGNIIIFIDEIHNLVGSGDGDGSAMNAANLLKPPLSRGEVQVIGATTFKEYRKYIEKDAALERRFQPITVNEPSVDETYEVLCGIKKYYEEHHKVTVSDNILRLCAKLSERYINERFLPDKAIDLLDESCANRSIRSRELSEKREREQAVSKLEEDVKQIEDSETVDYEKLAEKRSLLIREKNELESAVKAAENVAVEEEDVAKVIELWTGIPAGKIEETEYKRLAAIEERLSGRIIGQDEAVKAVSRAIKRARMQLSGRKRPASFIFVGPTGVGKTELVKVINDELFAGTDTLIRINMNEFMEPHTVARLIGSPPGYVGFEEAGQLTEKVRRHPYSVILFDEIEKAHPDIMNILLQILDEGRINDSQGRNINFENTIICMTSNAGSADKTSSLGFNKTAEDISKDKATKALSQFLRPEFLGRVDEVIVFKPLSEESYAKIACLMLDEMKAPLLEKGITFTYDDRAAAFLAKKSFGGKFGGRDLRNAIRDELEDRLADIMIEKGETGIRQLSVSADDAGLTVDVG
ncbi:MAG: ATP-dependent Clp protease ATP-binding subunit [Oscillospiraceae bacterium]|nr:ATP-dependent Clp protease ATP-binding subunit [Oscillospiraceae bacterium]